MIALRVTLSIVEPPASVPASRKISATGGLPANAAIASPTAARNVSAWPKNISRRRSIRSAIAPPNSDATTIGISSTMPSSPTSAAEPVST